MSLNFSRNKSVLHIFIVLCLNSIKRVKVVRSHRGVGDKHMPCKPGVVGFILGFSQSVG